MRIQEDSINDCASQSKSVENSVKVKGGRWTDEEHNKFLEALRLYGKDWLMVEKHVGTRSSA